MEAKGEVGLQGRRGGIRLGTCPWGKFVLLGSSGADSAAGAASFFAHAARAVAIEGHREV